MIFTVRFFVTLSLGVALSPAVDAQAAPSASAIDATLQGHDMNCRPRYPAAALRSGAQGATVLSFHLDESGKIVSGKVVRSSGTTREHRMLDDAALNALMSCPIKAELDENGHSAERDLEVTYTWRLQ